MKQVDLCICDTSCGDVIAEAEPFVLGQGDEVILDTKERAVIKQIVTVFEDSDYYAFIRKYLNRDKLIRIESMVQYVKLDDLQKRK